MMVLAGITRPIDQKTWATPSAPTRTSRPRRHPDLFGYTFQATGCDDLDSGNSNCGHEYGTTLSESDEQALLEYLKTL